LNKTARGFREICENYKAFLQEVKKQIGFLQKQKEAKVIIFNTEF
jgi:hypothetical protein